MEMMNFKSTAGVINGLTSAIRKGIIKEGEELPSTPASFINILMDSIGSLSSANFYETLAIKNELHKSTARSERSLIRYLDSEQLVGIYGKPAVFSFSIGFSLDDIVQRGVSIDINTKKVTINKNLQIMMMSNPEFTLDYNIEIIAKYKQITINNGSDASKDINPDNYLYFAKFVYEESSVRPKINNPFITTYMKVVNGKKYIMLKVPMKQYYRRSYNFNTINSSMSRYDFELPFNNNIYGFEVLYKKDDKSSYELIKGYPDGEVISTGYNYSIVERPNGVKFVRISFNRNPDSFAPIDGSSLFATIYETSGEAGNFFLVNWNRETPPISKVLFNQNTDKEDEIVVNYMIPAVEINGPESTGGRNKLSLDKLRTYVVNNDDSKTITMVELEAIAKDFGMRLSKERFDLLEIYFKLTSYLEDNKVGLIQTLTDDIELIPDNMVTLEATNSLMLTPKHMLQQNTDGGLVIPKFFKILPQDDIVPYKEYVMNYNKDSGVDNYYFPFFMMINNSKYIEPKIYNMCVNDLYEAVFEFFNYRSSSQASINDMLVYRNPKDDIITNDGNYEGKYKLSTDIQVSELVYNSIVNKAPDIKLVFILRGISDDKKYILKVSDNNITIKSDKDKIITVTADITTDCAVNNLDKIYVKGIIPYVPGATTTIPDAKYFIDSEINIDILVAFRGTEPDDIIKYQDILSESEINDGFKDISAVYTVKNVKLLDNLTDLIKPIVDVKPGTTKYTLHETNVYKTYKENVYDLNPDGTIKMSGGLPIILHKRGEFELDANNNKIILYAIGDIVLSDKGEPMPAPMTGSYRIKFTSIGSILVNRIYDKNSYLNVVDAFYNSKAKIDSIVPYLPTGVSGKLATFNTVTNDGYYFIDRSTSSKIQLDRVNISVHIGIKLLDDVDKDLIVENTKIKIIEYIRNNSTSTNVSFMEMLEYIKDTVLGIKFCELYTINNYNQGSCQQIVLENPNATSVLNIKSIVDITNSNIDTGNVVFKPDIKVTVI